MGRISRLAALGVQLHALLPREPVRNPTVAEIKAWGVDIRMHMARGHFAGATPEEWADVLSCLEFVDELEEESREQQGPE